MYFPIVLQDTPKVRIAQAMIYQPVVISHAGHTRYWLVFSDSVHVLKTVQRILVRYNILIRHFKQRNF